MILHQPEISSLSFCEGKTKLRDRLIYDIMAQTAGCFVSCYVMLVPVVLRYLMLRTETRIEDIKRVDDAVTTGRGSQSRFRSKEEVNLWSCLLRVLLVGSVDHSKISSRQPC